MSLPINASDDLRIGASGATSAWMNGVQVWPADACIPAWTYVRGAIGTGDIGCALSLDGSTVYACDRTDGVVRTVPFPSLSGSGTTVYTEPSGFDLNSVTDTPDGPLVVVCSHADGHGEVRDFADNVIYTAGTAISTNGVRAVWNPVDSRLYVLRRPTGGADHILYSMDNDGSSVVTEFDSVAATGVLQSVHGFMVTSDGAVWFNSITGSTRNAARILGGGEVLASGSTTKTGLAHHETDTADVYQTVNATSTDQLTFSGGSITIASASPHVFDGYDLIQSSATPDFASGVAFGVVGSTYAWFVFTTVGCP